MDEKDLHVLVFPLTFKSAIFSSGISPATVCSTVQIVVLLLKHFYGTSCEEVSTVFTITSWGLDVFPRKSQRKTLAELEEKFFG